MCGRFTLAVEGEVIKKQFRVDFDEDDYRPGYNIAPGQSILAVVKQRGQRVIAALHWGLIPGWAKDKAIGYKIINARAETIAVKPAFKESFVRRRCLIPADGFFEWKKENGSKLPYRILLPDRQVFAFAGIWDSWTSPLGITVVSCTIITTRANEFMQKLHDRMPVILAEAARQDAWLEANNVEALSCLLQPYQGKMEAYRVSTVVNSPRNNSPEVIKVVL